MPRGVIRILAVTGFVIVAATATAHAQALVAAFSNVSDKTFTVLVAGPKDDLLDFAACKGVWFAAQKGAPVISFGNPVSSVANNLHLPGVAFRVPDGTATVTAVVYLNGPSPDGNRMVDVAQQAAVCRRKWNWYR